MVDLCGVKVIALGCIGVMSLSQPSGAGGEGRGAMEASTGRTNYQGNDIHTGKEESTIRGKSRREKVIRRKST